MNASYVQTKPWGGNVNNILFIHFKGLWRQHIHLSDTFSARNHKIHTLVLTDWHTVQSVAIRMNSAISTVLQKARPHSKYWLMCWPVTLRLQRRRAEAISADQRRRLAADVTEYAERLDNKGRDDALTPRRPNGPLGILWSALKAWRNDVTNQTSSERHDNLPEATVEAFDWIKWLTFSKSTTSSYVNNML